MGVIIQALSFSSDEQAGLLKPIIYCCQNVELESIGISINLLMAEKLLEFEPNRRTMLLERCFSQILETLHDGVLIQDFDVMFNPEYQVDLLSLMISACKKKPFSIIWPGRYEDGKLIYAEIGYSDYKVFKIEDYDVTCIV
jgi:hypothetical protein